MFNSISGIYSGRGSASLFLMNSGIEWNLTASENTINAAAAEDGEIRIYTYLHHKEDAMTLYGFSNIKERSIFLELIKVSGIGPKQAVKMLSSISPERLISVLDEGDTEALSALPGIGKKTAAKIVLALRGKLKIDDDAKEGDHADIIEALAGMGFDRKSAAKALKEITARSEFSGVKNDEFEKELFREAIVFLSSK